MPLLFFNVTLIIILAQRAIFVKRASRKEQGSHMKIGTQRKHLSKERITTACYCTDHYYDCFF